MTMGEEAGCRYEASSPGSSHAAPGYPSRYAVYINGWPPGR